METKYGNCSECFEMTRCTLVDERWLCNSCIERLQNYYNGDGEFE